MNINEEQAGFVILMILLMFVTVVGGIEVAGKFSGAFLFFCIVARAIAGIPGFCRGWVKRGYY